MAEAGVHDLIRSICGGAGNRFKGSRCHYYEPSTGDCSLLKEGKMDTLFEENPRCNPKRMLEAAVSKNYRRYKDSINPADYITATAFTLLERLKEKRLTRGYNLAVLHGYINQAAYNEVQKPCRMKTCCLKDCAETASFSHMHDHQSAHKRNIETG